MKKLRLLFQGDSITDWGRSREDLTDLGQGYPRFVAPALREAYPDVEWEFVNRGVGGERTKELLARWQQECIDLQPDILSILVGINDTWRAFDRNDPTTVETFESNYRRLLEDVKKNTAAKLLMMEPFVLHNTPDKDAWRADLDPKIHVVRKLAREYADAYLPLDGILAAACVTREPSYWSEDGVHPSQEGAKLIAKAYVEAVGPLIG